MHPCRNFPSSEFPNHLRSVILPSSRVLSCASGLGPCVRSSQDIIIIQFASWARTTRGIELPNLRCVYRFRSIAHYGSFSLTNNKFAGRILGFALLPLLYTLIRNSHLYSCAVDRAPPPLSDPKMFPTILLALAASPLLAIAVPYPLTPRTTPSSSCTTSPSNSTNTNTTTPHPHPRALYLLTNTPQNSILALPISPNGTLHGPGTLTPTAGTGASAIDAATNRSADTDTLFSQSALKASGSYLVAVNAGSNTLSLFSIAETDATLLTPIGAPVDTGGEFPVSVALDAERRLACVANTGARAGVACFHVSPTTGLTPLSANGEMIVQFEELRQSTPPKGPLNTVSHTLFSEDGSALITTVKGDPSVNKTGFVSILEIEDGCPATQDRRYEPKGTAVLFGSAVIPGEEGELFATDASFGAVTLSLPTSAKGEGEVKVLAKTTIAGQLATCWAAISPLTHTAFVTDVGVNRLVEIDPATGAIKQSVKLPNGNPGMIDLVASKAGMVYALAPGNGGMNGTSTEAAVVVVDVRGGGIRQVQNFDVSGMGVGSSAMGLTAVE